MGIRISPAAQRLGEPCLAVGPHAGLHQRHGAGRGKEQHPRPIVQRNGPGFEPGERVDDPEWSRDASHRAPWHESACSTDLDPQTFLRCVDSTRTPDCGPTSGENGNGKQDAEPVSGIAALARETDSRKQKRPRHDGDAEAAADVDGVVMERLLFSQNALRDSIVAAQSYGDVNDAGLSKEKSGCRRPGVPSKY